MKTAVETIDPVTRKLTVEVEPQRVKQAFDAAARELAKQVDIPGFRKGKAPRRLIEQRFGPGALAQTAMEDALNDYYAEALEAEELRPVSQPDVDVKTFDEAEGCTFEVTIEVTPEFDVPDHAGIDVSWPEWDVMDADIEAQLDQMRERFAEVDEVDRPAEIGDYVTIDITTTIDGEELDEATVEDALYEIGSQGVTPKLDDELPGHVADDEFTYTDALPDEFPEHGGAEATFVVTVKDVRAKTLPEVDDDFAATASEFDTVQELRADIRSNLLRRSISEAQHEVREQVVEAYLATIDIPVPPSLVDDEVDNRRGQLEGQAEQYGMSFEELLATEELDEESWADQARENAESSVKARLVLDELGRSLGIEVTQDDANMEIVRHAMQMQISPDQVAQIIQSQGSLPQLVGDIHRRKTIDAIIEAANLSNAPDDAVLTELGLKRPEPGAEFVEEDSALADVLLADADADSDDSSDSSDSSDSGDSSDDVDSTDDDAEE